MFDVFSFSFQLYLLLNKFSQSFPLNWDTFMGLKHKLFFLSLLDKILKNHSFLNFGTTGGKTWTQLLKLSDFLILSVIRLAGKINNNNDEFTFH